MNHVFDPRGIGLFLLDARNVHLSKLGEQGVRDDIVALDRRR